MNHAIATLVLALAAAAPAMADDKDDVKAAAKKLSDAPNYSWTTTVKNNAENAGGAGAGRFAPGPIEGQAEKDGVSHITMKQGETTFEAAFKGEKFALKVKDVWMGAGDVPGAGGAPQGRPDPAMFMSRMLKNIKPGAQGIVEAIDKLQNVKSEGDGLYTGEFTPEGAKDLLAPKVEGQPANPNTTVTDAKGSLKIWIKDGMIVKLESTMLGKMMIRQQEREINRTATTEIKNVGSTKIELPDEAKKKLE
jgi:hypothetical protein